MKSMSKIIFILGMLCYSSVISAQELSIKITKRYLNFPISQRVDRKVMKFEIGGQAGTCL